MQKNRKKSALNLIKKVVVWTAPCAFFCSYPSHADHPPLARNQKSSQEALKALEELTQYEIDESFLITQCIDNVNNPDVKTKLMALKGDCEESLKELSSLVKKYEGKVPEYSQGFKGYFMNGYAAMRGAFTDQGALKALDTNLKLILKAFESALNSSLPKEAEDIVKKICGYKKKAIADINREIHH